MDPIMNMHVNVESPHQKMNLFNEQLRNAMRLRIYAILQRKLSVTSDLHEKLISLTKLVEAELLNMSTSEQDYSDFQYLEFRLDYILTKFQTRSCPSTSHLGNSVFGTDLHRQRQQSEHLIVDHLQDAPHMHIDLYNNSLTSNLYGTATSSCPMVVPQDTIIDHTFNSNQPNLQAVLQQTPLLLQPLNGQQHSQLLYPDQLLPTLNGQQHSQHLYPDYLFSIPNGQQYSQQIYPDHLFPTPNGQQHFQQIYPDHLFPTPNEQQHSQELYPDHLLPTPNEQQHSQQLYPDHLLSTPNEQQHSQQLYPDHLLPTPNGQQHSQQFYPDHLLPTPNGQQHSQQFYPDHLLPIPNGQQHSQQFYPDHVLPTAPLEHGPIFDYYKEALLQHAVNGLKLLELQHQQINAVSDHFIVDSSHSTQLSSSSPSSPPHPQQKQPEAVNRCSSAADAPISSQNPSPTTTAERKHLPDGNNATSSKQVNGDRCRDSMEQGKWLLFLLHARYCSATQDRCQSKFCFPAKKLLIHVHRCKIPDCTYERCTETRELLLHYKDCTNKSCPVCVYVRNFKKKQNARILLLHGAKRSSASVKCQPRESSESMETYNKGGFDAPFAADDLQPSAKRRKIDQRSQNATPETESNSVPACGVVCKSHPSMAKQEKHDMQSDDCKSVRDEVTPMDINDYDASLELEKQANEDMPKCNEDGAIDDKAICLSAQGNAKCMNEMSSPEEESVKQSVDASTMEISSLVELFTIEQVKGHIRSLRQCVGQSKSKADKNKAMESSISVNACQLCAVESLVFEPKPIYCSPCGVRIKRNALHYSAAAGESQHYVCVTCYNEARKNSVSVDGTCIPKARLEKKKNDEQIEEGWVQCDKCEAWQHQICALFNSRTNHGEATKYTCPNCYIQEVEQGERKPLPEKAIPGAKSLPVTTLSNHIEQRLFKKLKKERQARAISEGKSYEEVPGAEPLSVRVVASVDKVVHVKEHFLKLFREENYPTEFPYKSKAILLFQKIESVEVCIFGMFVQEFGTESDSPNQRRVYLSYLDSVQYFRPEVRTVSGEALRTFVYHEILIGYLDYCKKRGFTSCHIWACPPIKGEDYILYCHPQIQKTPKTDKLRQWYLEMLRKASNEDVVVECTNLYDQFFLNSGERRAKLTAARLPYFDGDYWPGAAEDLIHGMSLEDDDDDVTTKVTSTSSLRALSHLDLSVNASKDRLMMQKLGEIISPIKKNFIVVHLQHCCKHCCTLMVSGNRWVCNQCKNFQICDKCNQLEQKRAEERRHPVNQKEKHTLFPVAIKDVPIEIEDKDDNIESEFFDSRQAFLGLCQGNNYQYDTLRRAKHSSMMLLYHLHNPNAPAFATTCTICHQEVENAQGWSCQVCPGYDVCNACYSKASIDHSHNLISRSDSVVQHKEEANQNYQIQLEKLNERLVHVAACRSKQCRYEGCPKWKILFRHILACKTGSRGCQRCKRVWRLIKLHARCCRDSHCSVPKCRDFRAISSRQQHQLDRRRRAAVMDMMRERTAEATHTS